MNLYRLLGDLIHTGAVLFLIYSIHTARSCSGVSFKSQALFLAVFITRYLDLLFYYISIYNTVLKLFFLSSGACILFLMRYQYRATYDPAIDTFRTKFILVPCFIFACIFNYQFTVMEVLWSFSIFLETVAIVPQLYMLSQTGEGGTMSVYYLVAMCMYRAMYIPNWIYRYFTEGIVDPLAATSGIVQTVIYLGFFFCTDYRWAHSPIVGPREFTEPTWSAKPAILSTIEEILTDRKLAATESDSEIQPDQKVVVLFESESEKQPQAPAKAELPEVSEFEQAVKRYQETLAADVPVPPYSVEEPAIKPSTEAKK